MAHPPLSDAPLLELGAIDRQAAADAELYDYVRRLVRHRIVGYLSRHKRSNTEIARILGVSHTAVGRTGWKKPLPPLEDPERRERARELAAAIFEKHLPWRTPHGQWPHSEQIMERHGVTPERRTHGTSDSPGHEWVRAEDGLTVVLFTESRWDGVPTATQPEGDSHGRWRILECRPAEGACDGTHVEITALDLGLHADALNFTAGRQSDSGRWEFEEVRERIVVPQLKERYAIVDLADMNLGVFDL
jgi:PAS domain-containing protein